MKIQSLRSAAKGAYGHQVRCLSGAKPTPVVNSHNEFDPLVRTRHCSLASPRSANCDLHAFIICQLTCYIIFAMTCLQMLTCSPDNNDNRKKSSWEACKVLPFLSGMCLARLCGPLSTGTCTRHSQAKRSLPSS